MMKFVFLTSFFFSTIAFACEVKLPAHLVILGERANLHQAVESRDCSENIMQDIYRTLSGVEGRITSTQLSSMLNSSTPVTIHPAMIQVQQFKQIVHEQLMLPAGVQLRETEAINSPGFLTLAPGDRVEVQCTGCLYGTGQPLNVNVYGFDGSIKALTVRADFKKMVKAYRLMNFMPAFSKITLDVIKEEYIEAIPQTELMTNLKTLKFYKLNKPLKAGELLKLSDLNAISLVKAGLKTQVIIENALVRIKTDGISRSNGSLGDTVEVFHAQKNKKYQGKVVGINKVLVEL